MNLMAFSVYDNKALNFSPPFFVNTDGAAVRMFSDLANDMGTNVGRHPSDFSLFCVGSFDDSHGFLDAITPRRHVIDATALLTIKVQTSLFPPANGSLTERDMLEDIEAEQRKRAGA